MGDKLVNVFSNMAMPFPVVLSLGSAKANIAVNSTKTIMPVKVTAANRIFRASKSTPFSFAFFTT